MQCRSKAWLNLALYAATLVVNTLGALGYINGLSQKAVSDRFDTLITPPPFAFSIWFVLYVLVLVTLLYWLATHKQGETARLVDDISPLFWLSNALNIAWVIAFSYELVGLAALLIFGMVITLTLIGRRLLKHRGMAVRLAGLAFGLYTGWLLIATFVNISAWLVQMRWTGWGVPPATWAAFILAVAVVGAFLIQHRLFNAAFTLPIAWAYVAIWQRQQAQHPLIGTVALIGAAACVFIAGMVFFKNRRCVLPLYRAGAQS